MQIQFKYKQETNTRRMNVQYTWLLFLGCITVCNGQGLIPIPLPGQDPTLPPRCANVPCTLPTSCSNPVTPPGQCCPECPQGPDCSLIFCGPPPICRNQFTPEGECCPRCRTGAECSRIACYPLPNCFNSFTPEGECCPRCGTDCRVVRCGSPPTNCPTTLVIPPGGCCLVCPTPDCSAVLCEEPRCRNPVTPRGECCPTCGTAPDCLAVSCPFLGDCRPRHRPRGECCDQCGVDCSLVRCQPLALDCPRIEQGGCCLVCVDRCDVNGQMLNEGDTIKVDCNTCQCSNGQLLCTLIACVDNPGTCPAVSGPGHCADICSSDHDCTPQQKCCSNGCGHVCMEAIRNTCNVNGQIVNDGDSVKVDCNTCRCRNGQLGCTKIACMDNPGTCPAVSGPGHCADICSSDHDCTPQQKCCSNGCGHVCMEAIRNTCNVNGQIVNDGDSVKVDCNTCTCRNGQLGCTKIACREKPGRCPALRNPVVGRCPDGCSSDHDCPKQQKCCTVGCGRACFDPLPSTCDVNGKTINDGDSVKVDCNTCTCRHGSLQCTEIACVERPGTCPRLRLSAGRLCSEPCSSDHDCTNPRQKCCFSPGCGRTCMNPISTPGCTLVDCPRLPRRCRRRNYTPPGECCPVCRRRPRPGPDNQGYGRRRPVIEGYGSRRD